MKLNTKILIVLSLVLILISQNLEARKLRKQIKNLKDGGVIYTEASLEVI